MIDAFYIFTKGGLLLWSTQLVKIKGDPLDRLIKEVLLEERVGETFATMDPYNLKWKLLNEMDLFFVVVYQGILQMVYLESLLDSAAKEFVKLISDSFGDGMTVKTVAFDAEFKSICQKADAALAESKKVTQMRSFSDTKKGKEVEKNKAGDKKAPKKKGAKGGDGEDDDDEEDAEDGADSDGVKPAAKKTPGKFVPKKKKDGEEEDGKKKKGKEARQWDGATKVSKNAAEALDFSKNKDMAGSVDKDREQFLGEDNEMSEPEIDSLSEGEDDDKDKDKGKSGGLFKSMTSKLKNLTGGAVLTEDDLEPILNGFKTELMRKNVAADVAEKLAQSVRTSLLGRTTERFTSIAQTVKVALQDAMETLLTPKKSIDVLRAALSAKAAGRVYTIVFLGVNGVGKSTNLAKVAYYLKHKGGLNVMIAACDTFRAGAVEQLKTHTRCLDVHLFERGYGKDPADIAKHAISEAGQSGYDVVLVDTAGRMQDNEPLMKALAKLVCVNTPDLVLFVGEALVGNDAIDQVTKFNRSLIDMSPDPKKPRGIDGMLLTKYDTVDDKVGAALSMVYVTGQPVVFVGTGQKYTHLRKLQVKEVVKTILG